VVTVTETEGGASSEVELVTAGGDRPPRAGRLLRCIATRSAGTATTRQPRLGIAAAATTGQIRYQATTTAVGTTIDEQPTASVTYEGPALYHRSQPDAGSDNAMITVYHFGPA
jgi:hypothetical protein